MATPAPANPSEAPAAAAVASSTAASTSSSAASSSSSSPAGTAAAGGISIPKAAGKSFANPTISHAGRSTKDATGELDAFELHKQKVRELELRNENKLDEPGKHNHNHNEEERKFAIALRFNKSQAHTRICEFLHALATAATDRTISSLHLPAAAAPAATTANAKLSDSKVAAAGSAADTASTATATAAAGSKPAKGVVSVASAAVMAVIGLLERIDALVDATPPVATASRFGNVAFRDFCDKLKAEAQALVSDVVQRHSPPAVARGVTERVLKQVVAYLTASFGDAQRIDYGTGHELNFACFMYALQAVGVFTAADHDALVLGVFVRYLRVVRRLQTRYFLEPAGSRGVWGLDDYHFLPFLWGSAQLTNHKHLRPRSVRSTEIVEGFDHDYLYLAAIRFINGVKLCSFAEHSPMLSDITTVKSWAKVHAGLWKMYRVEVLGKFAVVQHFLYADDDPTDAAATAAGITLLPSAPETDAARLDALLAKLPPVPPLQMQKYELPCCTAGLKIPSVMAVKAAEETGAPAPATTDATAPATAPVQNAPVPSS